MTPETTSSSPEPTSEGTAEGILKLVPKDVPQGEAPELPFEGPTWEDDETIATGVLRAASTLLAAGFLAYAQWMAPATWPGPIGQFWGRWVWTSAVCNFALPLLIVWMFFGQGLVHQDWLKKQQHNAWNFGWNFKKWRRHLKIALVCWALFLPFLIYFSRNPEMQRAYAAYLPPVESPKDWAYLIGTLLIYMFCWEWFFRGFTLFGSAQGFGPIAAIIFQTIIFGLAHQGKPPVEMVSAFAGGLVLGVLAWREKSFFPAFLIHGLIHISWAVLVLL